MKLEEIREKLNAIDQIENYKTSFRNAIVNKIQQISTIDKLFLENTFDEEGYNLKIEIEQLANESDFMFDKFINKIKTEIEK